MDPAKLKVVELRAQLSQRGLDAKGNKAVLVERLRTALEEENATQDQGQINASVEDIHDSTVKENNEKSPEPTKLLQTPKSSGRSSRSSSMTTPTKVSTRSAPRTSTTPNSMKQSSPSKGQNTEIICETLPTISESVPQNEKDLAEEKNVSFSDKVEEREATDSSAITESKNSSLSPIKEDRSKKLDITAKSDADANVSQVSVIKSPKKSSEFEDRPLQEVKTNIEDLEHTVPVIKKEISVCEETIINTESNDPNIHNDSEPKQDIKKIDKDEVSEKDIQEEDESIEPEDTDRCPETQSDVKSMDIPELKPSTDDLCDQEQAQTDDLNDEQETAINDEQAAINESIQERVLSVEEKEIIKGSDDNTNDEEILQEIEMAETKQEDTVEVAMKESQDKSDAKDRKRKRSPSPGEDRQTTPHLPPTENEPEIDDAALILSWYDSDLNLVIDKDGFFTATPMYNDVFVDMWAGARASYGFLCGKVYYETKITDYCSVDMQNEEHPHVLRVGWSALHTSMQLGEEKLSFGYDNTEKRLTNNQFMEYGLQFGKDDVIGCYLDATSDDNIILSYTVNGEDQGMAFTISKEELGGKPLFPHILSRNCSFACNFGQEKPWTDGSLGEYVSIGNVDPQYKVPGPRRPEKKDDCEVIMMCGLPACGKTTWAINQMAEHPEKMYNILGLSSLVNKMKDTGFNYKMHYPAEWEVFIDKCNRALNKLLEIAPSRRRNYILDQVNVYPSAPRRKMKNFCGYQRKAVVVVPTEEEFKLRASKHKPIEGKEIADSVLMEMKANFSAPIVGEFFDAVEWVELGKDEGMKLIEKYNKEGKEAGYGQQQATKRPRTDSRFDSNRENRDARTNRDTRDNRDHRDRRGTYPERNRTPVWRGGGNMGWRDRPQRGGHARHGGGYGPPIPWRGRGAPVPSAHRGLDRRGGSGDRRSGNDRGRSTGSRQGGWAPMSNYQGSQQVWNQQQNNWSGGQSQSNWGQQSGWGGTQQWGNWKGYGQGSYNQANYNQQGYGNGNWNSWNQQYYNQYWGQQQPSGQTSAASGQAAGTTESTTAASSGDSTTGYGYAQEWQGYTQDYAPPQSVVTTGQRYRQHK